MSGAQRIIALGAFMIGVANAQQSPQQVVRSDPKTGCSLLGAAVADAASRPLHWVYDMTLMEELMKDGKDAEFWPESMSPFYTLPTGARSCYNHVVMAGL